MKRLLGIDYGRRKVGVAISLQGWPEPLTVLENDQRLFDRLSAVVKKHQIEEIVVGLPDGLLADEVSQFGQKLSKKTRLEVHFASEILTSREAIDKMIQAGKKKQFRARREDAFAAALILDHFLERQDV